jgi:hypothetical protein
MVKIATALRLPALVALALLSAGCGGKEGGGPGPGAAALAASATAVPAGKTTGSAELDVVPPSGSPVTSFQADVAVDSLVCTGDTLCRAVLGLRFQPVAARAGNDYTDSLYLRILLENGSTGLVARRQFFECTSADCSTDTSVGVQTAGAWDRAGVPIQTGTVYTARMTWDATTRVVTYALSIAGTPVAAATVDLTQGVAGSPALALPFEVSYESFRSAFLAVQVRGGAAGGGNGTLSARFDEVKVGVSGQEPTLFDDFDGEGSFDAARWTVHGTGAQIVRP